jgi:dihydroorotate dehydrogenase electron transfer subunit
MTGSSLDFLFSQDESLARLEGAVRLDRPLRLRGPGGRPFVVEAKTRRALLVGQNEGLGPLLHLAAQLVRRSLDVTLVVPRTPESPFMPASALPPEVEYVTPGEGDLLERLGGLLEWADALYLATASDQLPAILTLLRRRLLRMRKGFAQALLAPPLMPCGIGACDLCTVRTPSGYRRACRDGLVFDLLSLV